MPIKPFLFLAFQFCFTALIGQKLRLVTMESNPELFDYSNPYSLVSMLDKNREMIPSLVSDNQFLGVYHLHSLQDMGIQTEELSSFTTWTKFEMVRDEMGDTICLIRTEQTLGNYLDSILKDPDYKVLKTIDRKILEKIWNHSGVNSYLRIPFDYYFDTEHISALILEQRNDELWVHFVSTISGKKFIGLSLLKSQIMDANNFVFYSQLDSLNTAKTYDYFHNQALANINLFGGQNETHGSNFCQFGQYSFGDYCRFERMDYTFNHQLNYISENEGFIKNTSSNEGSFHIVSSEQSIGDIIEVMDWETGETSSLVKKQRSWKDFNDSLTAYERDALIFVDSSLLFQCFQNTEWNDFIRLPIKKNIYWVEKEAHEVYVLFNLSAFSKATQIKVQQVYFTDNMGNERVSLMQFSVNCEDDNGSLDIEIPKVVETINHSFMIFDNFKLKRLSFETVRESLRLINPTLIF